MNKILVIDGILSNLSNELYDINDGVISFKKSGSYIIQYVNAKDISITFCVDNNIDVNLQEISFDNELITNNKYIILGNLSVNKFYSNHSVFENITIDLNSENAKINYTFSGVCLLDEKYVINVNHNNKKTTSNISNKAVALKNSRMSFVINSNVSKEMIGSVLDQTTKVITFSGSDAKICPNMFIDCNDIVAKHGSVVGMIEDDILFYLMSRGIDYNSAIKLYIKGFLFSSEKADLDIRNKIFKIIDMYWR